MDGKRERERGMEEGSKLGRGRKEERKGKPKYRLGPKYSDLTWMR